MSDAATLPLALDFLFLLGLSFFLGLAFEDATSRAGVTRPGGVRTFPMLAFVGALLYLVDPTHVALYAVGFLILGAWLTVYYRSHIEEPDEAGAQNVGIVVALLNVFAYLLGAVAMALPHWVGVGTTVAVVLLFTGRDRLHALARGIDPREIITASEFLILTGLVLPLLPDHPITSLTTITPRQAWLALIVVCAMSYLSYLLQRYAAPPAGGLWMAALGGLYSSTATTVVLAREGREDASPPLTCDAGITLATAIMYLRILIVVAVFDFALARVLAPWFFALSIFGGAIAALLYHYGRAASETRRPSVDRNPLELGPALLFATLFVATSLVSGWVKTAYGAAGIYALAAVVGVTDIDPFVLNIAQGGAAGLSTAALAGAILIAASSNNILKAAYALVFGGPKTLRSAAALLVLALAGVAIAFSVFDASQAGIIPRT